MADYSANEKIPNLDILTVLDQADLIPFGDVSDSGKAKSVTQQNYEIYIANSSNFTTELISNTSFTTDLANDTNFTTVLGNNTSFITDLTNNATFQTLVQTFVSGGSGGGGGGISQISQTFSFSDFIATSGVWLATFTASLPADAVPVGTIFEFNSAFDSGLSMFAKDQLTGSAISSVILADAIGIQTSASNDHKYDFTVTPNPVVELTNFAPTQGSVTVTIFYGTRSIATRNNIATYDAATASGVQNIPHGLGRVPVSVRVDAILDTANQPSLSNGGYDGTTNACVYNNFQANIIEASTTYAIIAGQASNRQSGVITVDDTNIIITWTKTGTPNNNISIYWSVS